MLGHGQGGWAHFSHGKGEMCAREARYLFLTGMSTVFLPVHTVGGTHWSLYICETFPSYRITVAGSLGSVPRAHDPTTDGVRSFLRWAMAHLDAWIPHAHTHGLLWLRNLRDLHGMLQVLERLLRHRAHASV